MDLQVVEPTASCPAVGLKSVIREEKDKREELVGKKEIYGELL